MSPVTHFLTGLVFANCVRLDHKERVLVTLAAVAPDIDGLGFVPEVVSRNSPHPRVMVHALSPLTAYLDVRVDRSAIAFALARQKWKAGLLALVSFICIFSKMSSARADPMASSGLYRTWNHSPLSLQVAWRGEWGLKAWA